MKQRILYIVGLFILVNLTLLGLIYLQSTVMNNVRSYVRGEGLWSKAQKDAVFHLQNFVRTKNPESFQRYVQSLKVPLGDKLARTSLQAKHPNYTLAYKGLLAGKNAPADIPGMINFFTNFQNLPYMRDAIATWEQADAMITKLEKLGKEINEAVKNNNSASMNSLLTQLNTINWQLAKLEYDFSSILSEGARWIKNVFMWISLGLVGSMLMVVLIISRYIMKGIVKTEQDLRVSENRFKSLYLTNMIGIIDWHMDGPILEANDAFLEMIGYSRKDIEENRLNWRQLTPDEQIPNDERIIKEIKMKGYCHPYEKEFIHKNGHRIPVFLGCALLNGEHKKGICFVVNNTELKQAHKEMQLSATVFDASSDGILITDKYQNIIAVNKSFCQLSGFNEAEVINQNVSLLHSKLMTDLFGDELWNSINNSGCWQGDIMIHKKDGSTLPLCVSISPVYEDNKSDISHYVSIYTDISKRKAVEEQLRKLAHYDFLTGIVNRWLLNDRLKKTIKRAIRQSSIFAVLFIDLDDFKNVNDVFGHETGDKLLQEIAKRLKNIIRGDDTVARVGGDEFVILMENLNNPEHASILAKKIIKKINEPCDIDGHSIQVGSSIGISIYPQDGEDNNSILNSADKAMYMAKSSGQNKYFYYRT